MPLSTRIRRHLQTHIVGYLALFVALSGTALALPGHKQVKSDDLANGAVKGKALAPDAVSTAKLRGNAVATSKLAGAAVTAPKIAANAVTATALGDGAVTAPKLANDSVARQNIVQGTINGGKIANGAIDSAKVADASLLAGDFGAGQISDGFATIDGEEPFTGDSVLQFNPPAAYSAPRSGRLLITATMNAGAACTTTCDIKVAQFLDGTRVPGSTRTVGAGLTSDSYAVTSAAIAPVSAGAHQIQIRAALATGDTVALDELSFTGILLQ